VVGRQGKASRSWLVACLIVVVAGLQVAAAAAYYPLFQVNADDHLLGGVPDLTFNFTYMSSAGPAERLVVKTPRGYNASLSQAVGTKLGEAGIGLLPSGTNTTQDPTAKVARYVGSLVVMDPAAYAADTNAQACDPGSHTAVWQLSVVSPSNEPLTVPVAVDASAGGYVLTMCFDAIRAAGDEIEWVYFTADQLFRNPGTHGAYLFDGVVTPFASDGTTANTAGDYELRAYESMPQLLTASPTYDSKTKTFSVTGTLTANGRARGLVDIRVYGAPTANDSNFALLGSTTTSSTGSYSFSKRIATLKDTYVYTLVSDSFSATCPGTSSQPAGCASISYDGRSSLLAKVVRLGAAG